MSAPRRLPFQFQAVAGVGRLVLGDLAVGVVAIDRLELEVTDLGTDPGIAAAERFQRRRTRLRGLAVRVSPAALDARVAQVKKPLALLGVSQLAARLDDGYVAVRCRAADGLAAADLSFHVELVNAGTQLRALASCVRVHGHLPTPGPVIADRVLGALIGAVEAASAERPSVHGLCDVELDLVGLLLWQVLPPNGWRLPAVSEVELTHIRVARGAIEVAYGPAGARGGELGVRQQTQQLAAAHDLMRSIDQQLRDAHLEDAMRAYRALLASSGPDQPLLLERILALAAARPAWFFDGLELARQALGRWPKFAPAHAALASITLAQGDARQAAKHLEQVARLASAEGDDDQAALAALAAARLLRVLDPKAASQLYQLALQHDPASAEAADSLADRLADEQRWPELARLLRTRLTALAAARTATPRPGLDELGRAPTVDLPRPGEGDELGRASPPDLPRTATGALPRTTTTDLLRAVETARTPTVELAHGREVQLHLRLADVLIHQLGDSDAAQHELEAARALAPDDPAVHEMAASILIARDPEAAIAAWREVARLAEVRNDHRTGARAWASLGDLFTVQGRDPNEGSQVRALAEDAWRRSLELDPLEATALVGLASAAAARNDHAVAADLFERLRGLGLPQIVAARHELGLARSLVALGRGDEARASLRRATLAGGETGAEAHAVLADLADRAGDHDQAAAELETAIAQLVELADRVRPEPLLSDRARSAGVRLGLTDEQSERDRLYARAAALAVARATLYDRHGQPHAAEADWQRAHALARQAAPEIARDAARTLLARSGDDGSLERRWIDAVLATRPPPHERAALLVRRAEVRARRERAPDLAAALADLHEAVALSEDRADEEAPEDAGQTDTLRRAHALEAELFAQSGDQRARAQSLAAIAKLSERTADRVQTETAAAAAWLAADEPAAALPHGARAHAQLAAHGSEVSSALRREVLITLGEAAWRQRAWPDVIRAYHGLVDDTGPEPPRMATFRYRLAVAADRTGDPTLALAALRPLVVDHEATRDASPELRGHALRLYADLAERAGDLVAAATALEGYAAIGGDGSAAARADAVYRAGELFRRAERGDSAIRCLEAALRISEAHLPALDALETAWRERKDLERVAVILGRKVAATARQPQRQKPLLSRLGDLQDTLRRPDVALATHQRALEIDPMWRPSLRYVTLGLRDAGQVVAAAGGLAQLAGELHGDQGVDLAIVAAERKIAAEALAELVAKLDDAQLEAVRAVARPALERAALDNADVGAGLARLRGDGGDAPETARTTSDTQSGKVAGSVRSLRDAAARERAAGKLAEAFATLETANHVAPGDPEVLRELVELAGQLGDHQAAARHLTALADRLAGARRGDVLLELADTYYDRHDDAARGREAMRRAAEAFGSGARRDGTLRMLATEAASNLAWDIAVEALVAIALEKRTPADVTSLATALMRAGRDADAVAALEAAMAAGRFDDDGELLRQLQHEVQRKIDLARTLEDRAEAAIGDDAIALTDEAQALRVAVGQAGTAPLRDLAAPVGDAPKTDTAPWPTRTKTKPGLPNRNVAPARQSSPAITVPSATGSSPAIAVPSPEAAAPEATDEPAPSTGVPTAVTADPAASDDSSGVPQPVTTDPVASEDDLAIPVAPRTADDAVIVTADLLAAHARTNGVAATVRPGSVIQVDEDDVALADPSTEVEPVAPAPVEPEPAEAAAESEPDHVEAAAEAQPEHIEAAAAPEHIEAAAAPEPEHVEDAAEPEHVAAPEPEHVEDAAEPEHVAAPEPDHVEAAAEPEHVTASEPEHVEAAVVPEPEHVSASEPEHVEDAAESEAVAASEPEPLEAAAASEPIEAVTASEPETATSSEPIEAPAASERVDAVAVSEREPVVASEPEPVEAAEPEPVAASEPEPVEASEPEPVAASEPEPVLASEPEPVAASEPAGAGAAPAADPSEPAIDARATLPDVPTAAEPFELPPLPALLDQPPRRTTQPALGRIKLVPRAVTRPGVGPRDDDQPEPFEEEVSGNWQSVSNPSLKSGPSGSRVTTDRGLGGAVRPAAARTPTPPRGNAPRSAVSAAMAAAEPPAEPPSVTVTGTLEETQLAVFLAAASADRDRLFAARRADPDDPALLLALLVHLGDREPQLRRELLDEAARTSRGRALAIALHELAILAREAREPARAAALWTRAHEIDPSYAPVWMPLADALAGSDDTEAARELYEAIAQSPEYDADRRAFAADRAENLGHDSSIVSGEIRPRGAVHLDEAKKLAEQADWPGAIDAAERAVSASPGDRAALEALEQIYFASGNVTAASESIGRQLALADDPAARATLWRRRARLYRDALGRDAEAYRCLQEALACAPADPEIAYQLRTAAMVRGEWPLAAQLVHREIAAATNPRDRGALHLELALIFEERLEDPAQAQTNYELALTFDPTIPAVKLPLARRYEAIGRSSEAARLYEEAAATARAADRAGLLEAAARCRATRADAAEPDLAARLDRAEAAGDLDAAFDLAHQLWRAEPGHAAAFRVLATTHRASGDLAALTELTRVRARRAETPDERATAWLEVARLAEEVGTLDQAARAYDLALIEDPGHIAALDARGALAFRLADFATADLIYRDLGSGESVLGDDELALRRSIIAEQLGRDSEALALARAAGELAPGRRDVMMRIQELATRVGELAVALAAARAVIELIPLDDDEAQLATHFAIVDLLREAGQLDEAVAQLERILRDHPVHAGAIEALAQVHTARGDWPTATRYLYQLVPLAPSPLHRAERLYQLGEAVLMHVHDVDRADDVFLRASDLDPGHVPTLRRLLDVYWRADDPGGIVEVATELADKGALVSGPTPEPALAHALIAAALINDTPLAQRLQAALGDAAPRAIALALGELSGRTGRLQLATASTAIGELARRGLLDLAKLRAAAAGTPAANAL